MNFYDYLSMFMSENPHPTRSEILQRHDANRESLSSDGYHITNTHGEGSGYTSDASLWSLKRITLSQLTIGKVHRGHVLVCRTINKPIKIVSIMMAVEDPIIISNEGDTPPEVETGRVALYNFVNTSGPQSDMSNLIPVGTVLLIKEPYYKMAHDGMPMVRCDNPTEVIMVPNNGEDYPILAGLRWADTLGVSSLPAVKRRSGHSIESASDLQCRGNENSTRKDYAAAIDCYTKALGMEPKNVSLLLSRARTHLALQQFQQALKDTKAAAKVDGDNPEKQLLRAEALLGLRRNAESSAILEELAQSDAGNAKVGDLLCKIQKQAGEYEFGQYDILSIFQEAQSARLPYLNHADYVGPVTVVQIPGKGRRMVATGDIEEGALLLCSKAYAVVFGGELRHEGSSSTSAQSQLVAKIAHKLRREPKTTADLYELHAGQTMTPAFIERCDIGDNPKVDIDRITNIVRVNAFVPDVDHLPRTTADGPSSSGDQTRSSDPGKGLWLQPSFLQHACFANALHFTIGDLLFVRAMRQITKDEEVCVPFTSILEPYHKRRRSLQDRGLGECVCQLCSSERAQPQSTRDRRVQLLHEFDKMREVVATGGPDSLARLKDLVTNLRMTYPRASGGKTARSRKGGSAGAKTGAKTLLPPKQLQISLIGPLSVMVDLLSRSGQNEEALKVLLEIAEIEPRSGEIAHKRVDTAMRIARLYNSLGRVDERKQWVDVAKKECEVIYGADNGEGIWKEMYKKDKANFEMV
ncbi:hypothetical protein BC938DRAFT_474438 [Jimgerdemannia flammicorona]|uniref:SET domain-containing protein n=1 Tax=Jimgerdemannia flammicorona TaxID=994334 RepID=A0A433QSI4_9FUNG|nr:hypothetical protein BC938DRAFT_474438 [Jimgerdemannia flammicorona]